MIINPGRPFWSAFTAFFANMASLFAVESVDVTVLALNISWEAALTVSLIVAAAVYGKEKITEVTNGHPSKD